MLVAEGDMAMDEVAGRLDPPSSEWRVAKECDAAIRIERRSSIQIAAL
jgi:hypothetical protein